MVRARPPFLPASVVASRLLARSSRQHRGVKTRLKAVRSGLPSLDSSVFSWWGLTLLAGDKLSGRTTLAARIAFETARGGGRVLWLEQSGRVDTPVFRLLTGLSRVAARRVFVELALDGEAWGALEQASAELERLPLFFAEAHGATIDDLHRAVAAGRSEGPIELVVIDGLPSPGRTYLQGLETLARELETPVLMTVAVEAGQAWRDENALLRGDLPQRPGSLRLRLTKEPMEDPSLPLGPARVLLDLYRAGEGLRRTIALELDTRCRWIEEAAEAMSVGRASSRP